MRKAPRYEVKYVPHLGEVGCGSSVPAFDNVYPFMPKDELVAVALPEHIPARDSGIFTIRGLSLTDFGLFDGDELLVTKAFNKRDIDEDTVCVVYIHPTSELVAKRIEVGANMLTLKASGGGIADKEYAAEDVEIRYVVVKALIDMPTLIARSREAKLRAARDSRRKRSDENTPRLFPEKKIDDIPF